MKKWLAEKIFSDNKKTLSLIAGSLFFLLLIYQIVLLCYGTYFNSNSDDVAQYAPILIQYINNFKSGDLSFYNFTNNTGASVFADTYYVPIDVFAVITFLLSFIMNDIVAFSIVELLKVFLGVVVFAYFLQRKGFKNWTVALLSFMYFCVGGPWVFVTFPTYFSLIFYLPFSLLVIDWYSKGKKWILPLYSCALVFYNFYNAYTLFIFMLFVYIISELKENKIVFKKIIQKAFVFGIHIVLGVLMGAIVLIPSVLYILNYTSRKSSEFQIIFDASVYFKMIYNFFVYETGVMIFNIDGDYIQKQINYYVGIAGLFILILLFFMKDRTSKVYKWSLVVVGVMMLIPVFSIIFSGFGIAYTRWFNYLNIILIYFIGYVLNNFDFKEMDKKKNIKAISVVVGLFLLVLTLNIVVICSLETMKEFERYLHLLIMLISFSFLIVLYVLFYLVKKFDLLFGVFVIEMIVAMIMNFSVSFSGKKFEDIKTYNEINEILADLDIDDNSLDRVYFSGINNYNINRYTNVLINENSFHSFFTKYFYDYTGLYSDDFKLYTLDLNRANPYNSRFMNYKYYVLSKDEINYKLPYLDMIYENEKYVIYENKYYNSFYVYEDYYKENKILDLDEKNNYLQLERNLFNGVILDEGDYNLNLSEYENYEMIKKKNFYDDQFYKSDNNEYVVSLEEYKLEGYNGIVYLKVGENDKLKNADIFKGENSRECILNKDVYKCSFDSAVDKIVVNSYEELKELYFVVVVEIENQEYIMVNIDKPLENEMYLHYRYNLNSPFILKDELENERKCLKGICYIGDFNFDYILLTGNESVLSNKERYYFHYYYDSLEYYDLNKEDNVAYNKSLTYNKSTVKVSYTRKSTTSNDQVIVLPITYSEEWSISGDSEGYTLVRANGCFLGVVVDHDIQQIDFTLEFKPSGVKVGLIGSCVGFVVYSGYVAIVYKKRKRDKNEIV